MTIVATLPLRLLSTNALLRQHWADRQRLTREHRQLSGLYLRAAMRREGLRTVDVQPTPGTTVTITRCGPRSLDTDNVQGACKAVRDGVADALNTRDDDVRVTWVVEQELRAQYGVRIEVAFGRSEVEVEHGRADCGVRDDGDSDVRGRTAGR